MLIVPVFALHVVAVHVAAAGPLLSIACEWRAARSGDRQAGTAGRRLAMASLLLLLIGMALGGVLLVILWRSDPTYWATLGRVPRYRWWSFGGELVFYFVCMVPYVLLWERASRQRWWHRLLAVFAATNLLYHFPPFFTMLSMMSSRGELASASLDRTLYFDLLTDVEVLSRVVHHWLASFATTGVALMLVATRRGAEVHEDDVDGSALVGARVALVATILQLPAGIWVLAAMPQNGRTQLLGGEVLESVLFGGAIFATVLLLGQLGAASLGDASRGRAMKCAALSLVVVLLMSGVLHQVALSDA
jgi:hypothetical protein